MEKLFCWHAIHGELTVLFRFPPMTWATKKVAFFQLLLDFHHVFVQIMTREDKKFRLPVSVVELEI